MSEMSVSASAISPPLYECADADEIQYAKSFEAQIRTILSGSDLSTM
jgi:hypothetical protein